MYAAVLAGFFLVTLPVASSPYAASSIEPAPGEALAKDELGDAITEAIKTIPSYAGDNRSFVSAADRERLLETAELLERGIALGYSDDYRLFWMWKLQECYTLVGEDTKNRNVRLSLRERLAQEEEGSASGDKSSDDYFRLALEVSTRALELKPEGWYTALNQYYTHYVRGMALFNLGHYREAIPDYSRAMELAKEALDAVKENGELHVGDAPLILEKAEGGKLKSYMRLLESESAEEVAHEYYKHLSQVQNLGNEPDYWRLRHGADGVAGLIHIYTHSREFEKAREYCGEVLGKSRYSSYSFSYMIQGLLMGQLEDPTQRVESDQSAACLLKDAYNRERADQNKIYQMVWMQLLADREEHRKLSKTYMKFRLGRKPMDTYWDRVLCGYLNWDSLTAKDKEGLWAKVPKDFLKGAPKAEREERWNAIGKLSTGEQAEFIALVEQEVERRLADGELVGDLMNETWFFAGARALERARLAALSELEEEVALVGDLKESAMQAFQRSSSFPGEVYSYELDYARLNSFVLGRELGYEPHVGIEFDGLEITSVDPESLAYSRGLVPGEIVALNIHTPLTPTARNGLPELEHDRYEPQIGDLLQFILKLNGVERRIDIVVGAKRAAK